MHSFAEYCMPRYSYVAKTSTAYWRLWMYGVLAALCSKLLLPEGRSPGTAEAGGRAKYSLSRIPSCSLMVEWLHACSTWLRMRCCRGVAGAISCCCRDVGLLGVSLAVANQQFDGVFIPSGMIMVLWPLQASVRELLLPLVSPSPSPSPSSSPSPRALLRSKLRYVLR